MMPGGAEVISCANQGGRLQIWAVVDPASNLVERKFDVIMTGEDIEKAKRSFIQTVLLNAGTYVVHVFELHG